MVYTDSHTTQYSTIDFPKWVRKPTKCATHSHRSIFYSPSGLRILNVRTLRIDNRKRHSSMNCVGVHHTIVR